MSASDEPPPYKESVQRPVIRTEAQSVSGENDYELFLESLRSRDESRNESTSVPEGEYVDLYCVWGIEFYTPSHFDSLVSAFDQLTRNPSRRGLLYHDPVDWLHSLRPSRFSGRWMKLSTFSPTDEPIYATGTQYKVPMPEYFRHAEAKLYSVSTSLTALVVCFVFADEYSESAYRLLQEKRQTQSIPNGDSYTIREPAGQKQDDIGRLRTDVSTSIAEWFREQFPGIFSSGLLKGKTPTCEFLTTRQATPFPTRSEREDLPHEFMRLLDIGYGLDAWKLSDDAGLRFGTMLGWRHHAIMAIREDNLASAVMESEPQSRTGRVFYVDLVGGEVVLAWAVAVLMDECMTQLVEARHGQVRQIGSRDRAATALRDIENEMLVAADVAAVASEVSEHAGEGELFRENAPHFVPVEQLGNDEPVSLADCLHETIHDKAAWLQQF